MLMQRRSVDLPEPDGPMTLITSPLFTEKSMSRSTSWVPELLPRCSTLRIGVSATYATSASSSTTSS